MFDVEERVRLFFLPRYLPHIARIPVSIIFAVLGIAFLYKAILIKKQHVKESQLIKDDM